MLVFTTAGIFVDCAIELVCAFALTAATDGICELLALISVRFGSADLRFDESNFNLLSFLLDADFCAFGTAILLSLISADIRAGLLSFFSDFFVRVSLLELFADDDNNFDFVFVAGVSVLVFAFVCGSWLTTGIPDDLVVCSLFKLKLESLRSLRADEIPLLELVRFDICAFDERSDFSLLNNFNLSNIECLVGVAGVPFITILPLPAI